MDREPRRRIPVAALVTLTALAACQTYQPVPLEPDVILARLEARRRAVPEGEIVTLARAVELMREHDPAILEARAAYRTAQALADTPTPLPNPSLEVGALWFEGEDIFGSARHGAEAALGWSLFLDGRRGLTDELNALVAQAALVAAVGTEREEYLALRRDLALLVFASRLVRVQEELAAAAEASVRTVRRLIEAAQASALDLSQARLEALEAEAEVLAAREAENDARARLAARTGTWIGAFLVEELPGIPSAPPTNDDLRAVLLRDHPGLAARRADYLVAEKELHLEIARQYPALEFSFTLEHEKDTDTYGLPFGIEIPIFDRNQPGIAAARGRREEVRTGFEAEASRALAAVHAARSRIESRRQRHEILRTRGQPAAEETLALARRSLEAGAADALQYLAILRTEREVRVKTLEAEQALYEAWLDLEDACGAPMLVFPDPDGKDLP